RRCQRALHSGDGGGHAGQCRAGSGEGDRHRDRAARTRLPHRFRGRVTMASAKTAPTLPSPASGGGTKTGGLRERKKQKTRESIQRTALRLFGKQGYEATTVEQIAASAEISPR